VLASWPAEQRAEYLRAHPLPAFTPRSITQTAHYLAAVEMAARSGIGIDIEEYLTGVNAVAAPIRGPDGTLVALLWLIGFSARFTGEHLRRAAEQLSVEAEAISQALGGS
jgi:IclR family acetate operon transcriptional repressor